MNKMKKACTTLFLLSGILLFPVTTHASTFTYTVEQGDTLTKIAGKYHMTINDLMTLNKLASDKLAIGQALHVSQPLLVSQPQAEAAFTVHSQNVTDQQSLSVSQNTQTSTGSQAPSFFASAGSENNQISRRNSEIASSAKAIVNADALNVREAPSLEGVILSKLYAGTPVDIIEKGPEWTKIRFRDTEAYVASMYLTTPSELPFAFPAADKNEFTSKLFEVIQPLLKTRYVLGGSTPDGFDCSGFTAYVYQQFGITLPRTSEEQFSVGQEVSLDEALPGDLLFYDALNKGHISHVAIYVGDGMIVHANGTEVKYEKVANMHKLYPFYGVKRLFSLDSPSK